MEIERILDLGDNIKSKNKSIKIICLVVIVLVIVLLTLKIILKKKEGNTIANIRNYGYVVSDNNYIYYLDSLVYYYIFLLCYSNHILILT